MSDYDPIRRDRVQEIKTAISFSPSWSLLIPWMMILEQDGSSNIRTMAVDIENDMKLGTLVWMKGWENKYGMECRRYVGIIHGC